MKRIIFIILGSINICLAYAQSFNGQYISEWQWDMNKNTNLINQLRLELSVPIGRGKDSFEAATLHVAKTNDGIIDDWQGFSNIDETITLPCLPCWATCTSGIRAICLWV